MVRWKCFLGATAMIAAFAWTQTDPLAAQSSDYRIEAVNQMVEGNGTGAVELRMVHRTSGKAVGVATAVLDSELEMPMNGTSPMFGRVQHAPAPGSPLRFVVSVPMEGEWLLSVTAKSPDGTTVHDVVPIYVERTSLKSRAGTSRRQ